MLAMGRPRERVTHEDGVRLDLSWLARQRGRPVGRVIFGSFRLGERLWERRPRRCLDENDDRPTAGVFILDLDEDRGRGSLMVSLGALTQKIELVALPRSFGGRQWFFRCPVLRRRASVLWMPPGASRFASRQAWGRQVAYRSQFRTRPFRALPRAQDIRYRLGGEDFMALDGFPPPKPKGMHLRTYEAQLERLEAYEKESGFA